MRYMHKTHSLFKIFCISLLLSFLSPSLTYADETYVSTTEGCPSPTQKSIELNCKSYHQTTNYTCGPAAVMSLMHYYNRLPADQMNQKTELRIALEMGATQEGTTLGEIANWLSDHGFSVESGVRVSSDIIVDNLQKGIPTIIGVSHHWILAKGLSRGKTEDEDTLEFADSCCNTTLISRSDIDSMWQQSAMPGNHCDEGEGEYIVATPD